MMTSACSAMRICPGKATFECAGSYRDQSLPCASLLDLDQVSRIARPPGARSAISTGHRFDTAIDRAGPCVGCGHCCPAANAALFAATTIGSVVIIKGQTAIALGWISQQGRSLRSQRRLHACACHPRRIVAGHRQCRRRGPNQY